jgi:hypothetical protein
MAEIEFSVLARECLDRRIPDQASLKTEIAAWEKRRNNLSRTGEKAIYYRRCTNQIEAALSLNSFLTDY